MDKQENESTQTEQPSGRPIAKFSGSGGISVAVWKHKSESGFDNYSVRMDRSFKNKEGDYQSTDYLRDGDLLRAQKLLEQADEWIEQDKGRIRSTAEGQSR